MRFLKSNKRSVFEENKPDALKADIRMISGCDDAQTSADVSNVRDFCLPDAAGRSGGACTSTLLNILYKDETIPEKDYSFVEVLTLMREDLQKRGFSQIPQLTASKPIDLNAKFDFVPDHFTGRKIALLIGINYEGHEQGVLSGCHNDVLHMSSYIKKVHGFPEENIFVLMDDGEHRPPTKAEIIRAYQSLVAQAQPGDSLFFHYSGHGCSIKDDDGDEHDGKDEALVPVDYQTAGLIRDDDLLEYVIKPMPEGVSLVCLYDCCHSGTILDLPYTWKADGTMGDTMEIDESFNFKKLLGKFGKTLRGFSD